MKFSLFKNIKTILLFIIILATQNIYPKSLNLVILFEQGGENSNEFQKVFDEAQPAAVLKYLINAVEASIPVIASSPLIKFLGILLEYNIDDTKEQRSGREYWQLRLGAYFNKIDIYLSKNDNFVVILPKGTNLNGFNTNILEKLNFNNLHDLNNIFWDKGKFNIDIGDFEDIFSNNDSISKNVYVTGHGSYSTDIIFNKTSAPLFAGLTPSQYQQLLKFMNKIGCTFFCLNTCYGGGWNLSQMHKKVEEQADDTKKILFSKEQLNFPIAIFAVTDEQTVTAERINMHAFFTDLDIFLNNKKEQNIEDWIITGPIKKILSYISAKDIKSTPLVWLPGTDQFFKAVNVDNIVKIITLNSLIKLELLGKNVIDIFDEQAILIYPLVEPLPIVINSNKFPKITSMIPGKAHHFIKSIISLDNELENILERFGFYRAMYSTFKEQSLGIAPRAFFIGSLKCKESKLSGSELDNVLIRIQYKLRPNSNQLIPMSNFIARDIISGQYFKIEVTTVDPSLDKTGRYSNYIIEQVDVDAYLVKKNLSNSEAEEEIREELKYMTPNAQVLSEILSGPQSEKIFWKKIDQYLKPVLK